MAELLRCENLTHIYSPKTPFEFKALDSINLTIDDGCFIGLIGHTGSGKSTLIQHFNGLLQPTSGNVYIRGENIADDKKKLRDIRFKVGLVFQFPEYQLFEETVEKDIAFGPTNMGLGKEEIDRRVKMAAEMIGISDEMLKKSPFELSGGQKRRVAIAGVIAMEPELLILDEPTAGLDPRGRDEILGYIRAYQQSGSRSVVIVSHSMDDVAKNADRIIVMRGGRIIMDGAPAAVFDRADELIEAGLDVPFAAGVMRRLRQMGAIGTSVPSAYTLAEAAEILKKEKNNR
ncbi:MAG: energy-coupling factor transporter ATPase [Ruminococcaceae bacterium]|nr:energy-coupling factor transporter ATPase [Oscillospiraceae bacterium]